MLSGAEGVGMKIDAVKRGGGLLISLALMAGSAWAAWTWQANAYGQRLAQQETEHQTVLTDLANANSALIIEEQGKRHALEQWLAASDQVHYRALIDEKTKHARLRDRIATADLRLSAILDVTDSARCSAMPAATGPSGMVYGAKRAQLDSAHAQRIIRITNDGDQGLIALAACQGYVRGVAGQITDAATNPSARAKYE